MALAASRRSLRHKLKERTRTKFKKHNQENIKAYVVFVAIDHHRAHYRQAHLMYEFSCAAHVVESSARCCQLSQLAKDAYCLKSSSHFINLPGLALSGLEPLVEHHCASLQRVDLVDHLSGCMFMTLPAHLHFERRDNSSQHPIFAARAFSSAIFVALFIHGMYSSSGRRLGPTIFRSMERCATLKDFFSSTVSFHDSEHQSTVFETVALNSRSLCFSPASRFNKSCFKQ